MEIQSEWQTYQLLDSGRGRKLERFGDYTLIRPEPRAVWKPAASGLWQAADAEYVEAKKGGGGSWKLHRSIPSRWQIAYGALRMWVVLEDSRQVGVFPENAAQWDWIGERVRQSDRELKVLNLFGYTGLASLAAAAAGAAVTHIDSSRRAIRLGREDQTLSSLEEKPIRWIVEDAVKFAEREVRRGNRYDGIIFDPPKYGLGPKKERWEFYENFDYLCGVLRECLSEQPDFVVVTAYALESPPEVLRPGLEKLLKGKQGHLELGELVTMEKSAGRKIAYSITGRWQGVEHVET
ncbi:class I SAM-dependent methyltransferase [bacterium]|nr:class I SAM-dependent methyltransferase [bacterium]